MDIWLDVNGHWVSDDTHPKTLCGIDSGKIDKHGRNTCQLCHLEYVALLEKELKTMTKSDFFKALESVTKRIIER